MLVNCPLNHMQCVGTSKCIHFNKLCDGARDCEDGSDEGMHCRGEVRQRGAGGAHLSTVTVFLMISKTELIRKLQLWPIRAGTVVVSGCL